MKKINSVDCFLAFQNIIVVFFSTLWNYVVPIVICSALVHSNNKTQKGKKNTHLGSIRSLSSKMTLNINDVVPHFCHIDTGLVLQTSNYAVGSVTRPLCC